MTADSAYAYNSWGGTCRYAPSWVAAELERAFPSGAASAEPSDTNPY